MQNAQYIGSIKIDLRHPPPPPKKKVNSNNINIDNNSITIISAYDCVNIGV